MTVIHNKIRKELIEKKRGRKEGETRTKMTGVEPVIIDSTSLRINQTMLHFL